MKLAYFSPLPPAATGVADYSATLLGALARQMPVEIFSDDARSPLSQQFPVRPIAEFAARAKHYDRRLYHLGNSAHYGAIFDTLVQFPGAVVLHDGTLHHFFVDRTLHRGNAHSYVREMSYAHGGDGYDTAQAIVRGAFIYPFYKFPLLRRAVDAATITVAHSETIRAAVVSERADARIARIDHFAFPAPPRRAARSTLLEKFRLPRETFIVAAFGSIAYGKRAEVTLRAFAQFAREHPSAQFVWVGARVGEHDLSPLVQELGIKSRVRFTGRVDQATLYDYMHLTDVAINLRFPTSGEASGIVMRLLALGVPTIVSDAGWYAELPRGVVARVPAGVGEVNLIAAYLHALASNSSARDSMGALAREYAEARGVERAAEEYVRVLRDN